MKKGITMTVHVFILDEHIPLNVACTFQIQCMSIIIIYVLLESLVLFLHAGSYSDLYVSAESD